MKITNLFLAVFVVLLFISLKTFSQDEMAPPKPVDNKVYESMCGEWTAESDMMGMKMKQDVNIHWDLDHQFIFMELKSVGITNPNVKYSGLGVFGVDKDGKAKSWWFDNWGASAVAFGSGTFEDNKLTVNDGNEMFSETRTFVINGNEMTMSAKGTMKMGGKDMPFEETSVYKKK
jgi:hypothetical protein